MSDAKYEVNYVFYSNKVGSLIIENLQRQMEKKIVLRETNGTGYLFGQSGEAPSTRADEEMYIRP